MASKGSLGGGRSLPTRNFAILIQISLSDTGTSLTSTLYSQTSHQMRSGAPSALPQQAALYPSAHANQQIQVPAMTGVLWSVHLFTCRYNGPNHSAVVRCIPFTTFRVIWAA